MARTGSGYNETNIKNESGQANQAFATGQQGVNDFLANQSKLDKGQQIGPNPWQSAGYLGNVTNLQADALDSANNATGTQLARTNRATGGLNSNATNAERTNLGLQKMRLASQLTAGRAAGDYDKNIAYQQYLAGAPLQAAGAEAPYYNTGTNATVASTGQRIGIGQESQNFWQNLISGGAGAVAGGLTGGVSGALGGLAKGVGGSGGGK
jgi:hypothetical protein